jgi:protein gp37
MAGKTSIEWTETTWNPVTGCSKISAGCKNCYAARMANRLHAMGVHRYRNGFDVTLHPDLVELPRSWKQSRVIFVNSMSDLFHKDVPAAFIKSVFNTMRQCPHHTFQVLTKRADRLLELSGDLIWSHNIWMGVSVEDSTQYSRIRALAKSDAKVKFLSCEPLIGRLARLPLSGIDWVIVGGESGPYARPMLSEWVTEIRDRCQDRGVPYFFKQWGGTNKKATGRMLDGRTWDEMPPLAREELT